jgi:hypothetical protein
LILFHCILAEFAQPGEPALVGFRPMLRQYIQPTTLVGREPVGQPALARHALDSGLRRRAARARRAMGAIRRRRHSSTTSPARYTAGRSRSRAAAASRPDVGIKDWGNHDRHRRCRIELDILYDAGLLDQKEPGVKPRPQEAHCSAGRSRTSFGAILCASGWCCRNGDSGRDAWWCRETSRCAGSLPCRRVGISVTSWRGEGCSIPHGTGAAIRGIGN